MTGKREIKLQRYLKRQYQYNCSYLSRQEFRKRCSGSPHTESKH